jgi:hypothetical protein
MSDERRAGGSVTESFQPLGQMHLARVSELAKLLEVAPHESL